MNKKLLTMLIVAALSACSQAETNAVAPNTAAGQVIQNQGMQKTAEMQVTHLDAVGSSEVMDARPNLVVLDVRTPAEFSAGHIEGAINIDFKNSNFATEISKFDKSQDYLIHCRSGGRSTASLKQFKAQNFTHIIHMDGGIKSWNKSGLPTVK